MSFEGRMLKKHPSGQMAFWRYDVCRVCRWGGGGGVVVDGGRGDQWPRWRLQMWLEAPRRAPRQVPSQVTTQRGTYRGESGRRKRKRVSRGRRVSVGARSEEVDRESGERKGVLGGHGVQRDEYKANERQADPAGLEEGWGEPRGGGGCHGIGSERRVRNER